MNRHSNLLSGCEIVQNHKFDSKDLPEIGIKLYEPTGSWFEENKLNNAIDERYSLLKEPRIEKDSVLSLTKWDPVRNKVIVLKKKGKEWETYGQHDSSDKIDFLTPEEALFLLESNSLILMHGNIEMSIELSYSLLLSAESGCTLEQYRVFSHLSKLGYKLIRHKKPSIKMTEKCRLVVSENLNKNHSPNSVAKSKFPVVRSHTIAGSKSCHDSEVVLIDDSSSDSREVDDDDIVIVDVIRPRDKEVIDIEDDDSRDSDVVMLEDRLVEVPLEKWSFIHRKKFLHSDEMNDNSICLDAFIVSQMEMDILDEIPNVKGRKSWLYRPDERLIPDGIWPFHYKYLIDLNVQKNESYRGRGGYRGRFFRGRGWYLQRQVSQMKNYTLSLMNIVSELMGGHGLQVLPPPPTLMQNYNNRYQRDSARGRMSWGRISFSGRGACYQPGEYNNSNITETVELSDDEENIDDKTSIKIEEEFCDEDIKPKRIKLDPDSISIDSNSSIKIEPIVKEEIHVKIESTAVIKSETKVKTESGTNSFNEGASKESSLCGGTELGTETDQVTKCDDASKNMEHNDDTSQESRAHQNSGSDMYTISELSQPNNSVGSDCSVQSVKESCIVTESTNLNNSSTVPAHEDEKLKKVESYQTDITVDRVDSVSMELECGENVFGGCENTDHNIVDKPNTQHNENNTDSSAVEVSDKTNVPSTDRFQLKDNNNKTNTGNKDEQNHDVETGWKQLKGSEKSYTHGLNKVEENVDGNAEKTEEIDYGSPLIESKHCSSIDNVLRRLQIFEEYKSKKDISEEYEISVTYDVYLPNSTYYRNLPPDPDFRLIILRLEDNLPNADQMIHLRKLYNDKKNFLFAVILRESIAYYLYDNVCLPVDNMV